MLHSIEEALEDIKKGKMIIVVDDEDRENEGDLLIPAEKTTPEVINFMTKYGRGLICIPMEGQDLDRLDLPPMGDENTCPNGTAFTVSVDAKECHTGISAFERALTIERLIDPRAKKEDFIRPGHMFPLRAREGGVLERNGHTEAAIDLAKMAGCYPAGVICEILHEDGTMKRLPELLAFSKEHDLKIISIELLIKYIQEGK